jgi:hypothetical protein
MPKQHVDHPILEMALVGLRAEAQKIEVAMAAIRKRLGMRGGKSAAPVLAYGMKPKRQMSAAGRARIAAAQKARWAAFHAKGGKAARPAKKLAAKRTMSRERKAALVANLAKARAARAAKKATA